MKRECICSRLYLRLPNSSKKVPTDLNVETRSTPNKNLWKSSCETKTFVLLQNWPKYSKLLVKISKNRFSQILVQTFFQRISKITWILRLKIFTIWIMLNYTSNFNFEVLALVLRQKNLYFSENCKTNVFPNFSCKNFSRYFQKTWILKLKTLKTWFVLIYESNLNLENFSSNFDKKLKFLWKLQEKWLNGWNWAPQL